MAKHESRCICSHHEVNHAVESLDGQPVQIPALPDTFRRTKCVHCGCLEFTRVAP